MDSAKEIIKTIIIALLVIVVIILIVLVFSYNKFAIGKVIPKIEEYEVSDETKQELESEDEEQTEIITTYILDAAELKYYEVTKEYNKGKKHPFAEDASNVKTDNDVEDDDNGFYVDEGK